MPSRGTYAKYRRDLPSDQRFQDLYRTVTQLNHALSVNPNGRLEVSPRKASSHSFCSSATYLLFARTVSSLQKNGVVPSDRNLSLALADIGTEAEVIHGKRDGIGIFGHWNANGDGVAELFRKLDLGTNHSSYDRAEPGDFMKIFWTEAMGRNERGHLVLFLGLSKDGKAVKVWSSNVQNENGSSGYGMMWVERSRIKNVIFSHLEHPENLARWTRFTPSQKRSQRLIDMVN